MATNIRSIATGTDTSDATATAAQILSGYTAYAKGVKLTGTASGAPTNASISNYTIILYNLSASLSGSTLTFKAISTAATNPFTVYIQLS